VGVIVGVSVGGGVGVSVGGRGVGVSLGKGVRVGVAVFEGVGVISGLGVKVGRTVATNPAAPVGSASTNACNWSNGGPKVQALVRTKPAKIKTRP
jgi:hypothetical protein